MLPYLLATLAAAIAYLNVGGIIWTGVRRHLLDDDNGLSMIEQERQGHMAMLLPKFTVITFWPLVALFGLSMNVYLAIRAQVAPTA